MTFRQARTLKWGQLILGPYNRIFQFQKQTQFVRGRATYVELRAVPSGAIELTHIRNLTDDAWKVLDSTEVGTINLLFNPLDDYF